MKPVLCGLLTLALFLPYSQLYAQQMDTQKQLKAVHSAMVSKGIKSDQIKFKGDIFPHKDYLSWLENIQGNAKRQMMVDRFTRSVNPLEYNLWRNKIEAKWIEYRSDGLAISGAMLYPVDIQAEKSYPVLIYNRGGNAKSPWNRVSIANRLMMFAAKGYIVLASNYRGSRFSQGKDEFGGQDVNDVLALIELVKTIPKADASRIAMMGWSRGGQMTYQALRQNHQDIKAAIVVAGVSDQFNHIQQRPEMEKNILARYIPDYEKNKQQALASRSAIYWAEEISPTTPILLLHGTADWRVGLSHSQDMAAKLNALSRPHRLIEFEYGDHGLSFYTKEYRQAVLDWLDSHL